MGSKTKNVKEKRSQIEMYFDQSIHNSKLKISTRWQNIAKGTDKQLN